MKILITGAAGSLGRLLINQLSKLSKKTIYATDIKNNPFEDNQSIVYKQFDLRQQDFFDWVSDVKPNKIIHLASILQISASMPREQAYEIDVVATKKLLELSVSIGVEKFIVTTSGAAYGYFPENKNIITEDRPTKGNADYFYSAHKAEVELLMAQFRENHAELKQIVFRPGAILGPNFEGPIVDFFKQKIITGVFGYPGPFNFIWAEDVVAYLIEGLTTDITGQYNIAGDGEMSMAEIAKELKKPYIPLPALLIQTVLAFAKPLGLTQYGPEQVKFIKYRPVMSNKKIKKHFNHQPTLNSIQALRAYLKLQRGK